MTLNLREAQQNVQQARLALEQAEQALSVQSNSLRQRLNQHRVAIFLGSGFLGGIALATLPPKAWRQVGGYLGSGAAWLARSPFAPTLVGMIFGLCRPSKPPDCNV